MTARYFKPQSVTWWSGVLLSAMGLILGVDQGYDLGGIADMIDAWTGGIGSGALLLQGTGLIGLRGAMGQ